MIYEYECKKCGILEIQHKVSEEIKRCPTCKCKIIRIFSIPYIRVIGTATTVLQQAERNDKKLGKELLDIKRKEQKERKQRGKNQILEEAGIKHHKPQAKEPWFGKLPDDVDKKIKTNPEKTEKYIMTGEV